MAINFPSSPSTNDIFTAGSITYKWDGAKWIGLGVTPADRLVEGSNSLEINANNDLVWTGDSVLLGTATANVNDRLTIHDPGSAFMSIRSDVASDGNSQILDFGVGTADRSSSNLTAVIAADIHSTSGGTLKADLVFQTNSGNSINDRLRITSDGKVGIGQNVPQGDLHIGNISGSKDLIMHAVNNGNARIRFREGGSNTSGFNEYSIGMFGAGNAMTIEGQGAGEFITMKGDTGFVGINETAPGAQLTVKRASTSTSGLLGGFKLKQGSATNGNRISMLFSSLDDFDVAAVNGVIETHSGTLSNNEGRLEFWTKHAGSDIAVRGRFDSEGSFYNFADNHGIYTETSLGAGTVKYLYRGSHSSGSNIVFNVWSNGNVESATNSFGPVSDVKLKENIVDAGSQWEDFKAVQFRKYNFKEETGYETHTQLGVIAQELEAISPGLVYETPDLDRDGNEIGTTTKKVKASVLNMKAMVALQEAMARIEELEARLEAGGL